MKKNKYLTGIVLVGILLAFCIEFFIAITAARRGYGLAGETLVLQPDIISDYSQTENRFTVSGGAPFMVFRTGQEIGYVDMYFSEPLTADTEVILYYLPARDEEAPFDRFKRVSRYMVEGTVHGRIPVPSGSGHRVRLDIRGDFVLERMEAGVSAPSGELPLVSVYSQMRLWRLLVMAAILCGSFLLLYKESRHGKTGSNAKTQYGKIPGEDKAHIAYLDAVRVVAAILVITVHVIEPISSQIEKGSPLSVGINGIVILCLTCNLLFFFLSGALLLPYRDESLGTFFRKRMVKVVLPLLIYSFFYLKASCATLNFGWEWLPYTVMSLLTGQIKTGPHLWLIYKLIGAYLVTMPLRYMLKQMPERAEKQLTCMILIFMGIETLSLYYGISLGFSVFLNSWPGVFLMGYFLTRDWMRKYDNMLIAGGILSFAVSLWLSCTIENYKGVVANCSILMLLMSSAVFVTIMKGEKIFGRLGKSLSYVSRYSYSILLIHWYVLSAFVYDSWLSSQLHWTVQITAPIVMCFLWSLVLAIVVEHTVLALAEAGIKNSIGKFSNM